MASLKLPYYLVDTLKSQITGLSKSYIQEIADFLELNEAQKKYIQQTVLKNALKETFQVYTIHKEDTYESEQKLNSCPCPVQHGVIWDRCGYPCVNSTYRCIHHQHIQDIDDCEPSIELTRILHGPTNTIYLCDTNTNKLYNHEGKITGKYYPDEKAIVLYPN